MGALKSFAPTGTTPRSLRRTPSRPELLDAQQYKLVIELHFPNLAPMEARTPQPVTPPRCPISPLDSNFRARWTRLTPNCASSTGTPSPAEVLRCNVSHPVS